MPHGRPRIIRWTHGADASPGGPGLEHLLLDRSSADSVVLAHDRDDGPFRLSYHLRWDATWRVRDVELTAETGHARRALRLRTDGDGQWRHGDGRSAGGIAGCCDLDIWPTPFTNTLPIRRSPLAIGERRRFAVAWIAAPRLTVQAQPQAYTRLAERRYRFENLDGSGFQAEIDVDDEGIVLEYADLFRRVG